MLECHGRVVLKLRWTTTDGYTPPHGHIPPAFDLEPLG